MHSLSIRSKTLLLALLPLVLLGLLFTFVAVKEIRTVSHANKGLYEKDAYQSKRDELKGAVQIALKTVRHFYGMASGEKAMKTSEETLRGQVESLLGAMEGFYLQNRNAMSRKELEKSLIAMVEKARYGQEGYFWIHSYKNVTMVMHPTKPSLNGKPLGRVKDPEGVYLFNEMNRLIQEKGAGMVTYMWPKPGFDVPRKKVSYVGLFEPLGWVVGTGEYLADLTDEVKEACLATLAEMRFGKNDTGYFWVNDTRPVMVMHPVKPALDGKDLSGFKDPDGKAIFKEFAATAKEKGGGFVDYKWPKPGKEAAEQKFSYVAYFPEWDWVVGTGAYVDDIDGNVLAMEAHSEEATNRATLVFLGIAGVILVVSGLLVLGGIRRMVIAPINEMEESIGKICREGRCDLTLTLPVKNRDEIGNAMAQINRFIGQVREAIGEARSSALENASISNELSSSAVSIGRNAEETGHIIVATSDQGKSVRNKLNEMVREAENTREDVREANADLREANGKIMELLAQVKHSAQKDRELADNLNRLSEEAKQVGSILTVISDIADQTNLLALNAAIEAARAGEHGRGFAVVADEVRNLAERTQKSLAEINATIQSIIQAIADSSQEMNDNAAGLQQLSDVSHEVEERINATAGVMEKTASMAENTARTSAAMATEAGGLIDKIGEISDISAVNARSVEEVAAASEHLYKLTEDLSGQLDKFKT